LGNFFLDSVVIGESIKEWLMEEKFKAPDAESPIGLSKEGNNEVFSRSHSRIDPLMMTLSRQG